MTQILIIEDETQITSFLEKGLKANGFTTTVATESEEALAIAIDSQIDLVLLDLSLPGEDGLSLLQQLRGQGFAAPIIIVTARDDIQDKVTGFEWGADDYVTKPFRFQELLARIRARLRVSLHHQNAPNDQILQVQNLTLDLRTRRLTVNDEFVELSTREFILLETFMRHPNQVMSREQLMDQVWGYNYVPGSNVVDVYVGYLRKKLGNERIQTVRGMGYRLRNVMQA
ncbi:two component transcriptional regulator, winged helix family [Halothece sp. PCC 7418]|uniref:response regulator transcription factor n=1 Tax=Halothece sp. (strain PCC 7418) TaxID=65093 RepID=UPI0002A0860E|nr:response regulator transcription factor [Halothece sp. PCC 7418]AFZ44695.1 two component transcriptional regulator, winged helix family [Halothece sp. PCC 7418]